MLKSLEQQVLEKIIALLENIEYGTLHITVHDSKVTQIDKLEKFRMPLLSREDHINRMNKR
ncbi:hypothetical protein JOC77_000966 [Peribacillus deserti]|uniref:DUF2292 domain-containing protein n=1 Tax=Peribacillus deserti TaxID=673318 RepID=A0ABS2QFI3_9BACI|nr:YezD family protein [Peribacillus deserti]MBM7691559.1 hypothetical protein [Peribacillus deserti]